MIFRTIDEIASRVGQQSFEKDKTRNFRSSVTHKGQNVENPREISEAFNDHFVTIGPKMASTIQRENTDDPLQYLSAQIQSVMLPFVFQRTDGSLVKGEINRAKCSKSNAHDQIPVKKMLLKYCPNYWQQFSTLP